MLHKTDSCEVHLRSLESFLVLCYICHKLQGPKNQTDKELLNTANANKIRGNIKRHSTKCVCASLGQWKVTGAVWGVLPSRAHRGVVHINTCCGKRDRQNGKDRGSFIIFWVCRPISPAGDWDDRALRKTSGFCMWQIRRPLSARPSAYAHQPKEPTESINSSHTDMATWMP